MTRITGRGSSERLRKRMHPLLAHEFYIYEAVSKGVARVFYQEFEQRMKVAEGGDVEFRFHDVVFFLVMAAASGVVGNLAYDALKRAISAVRKPKLEGGGVRLSSVVSRETYNRERRKKHPGTKASGISPKIKRELEKQYELVVSVTWKYRKKGGQFAKGRSR